MTTEKPAKKKQPAYKTVVVNSTIDACSEAFEELETLGQECREIVDNSGDAFAGTDRIQTFEQNADTLENVSAVEPPDYIAGIGMDYTRQEPTRKGRTTSRNVRYDNALSILGECIDAATEYLDGLEDPSGDDNVQEFIDELQNVLSDVDGLDFPGMFG